MYSYLASPYSHADGFIRELRFRVAENELAIRLSAKLWTYAPIVHCHKLAARHDLPKDFHFWREYDEAMIAGATELLVLLLPRWQESAGVAGEVKFADDIGIPVKHIEPHMCDALKTLQQLA